MRLDVDGVSIPVSAAFACRDITFSVPSGAVLGIVGPNGSGKSTLLRSIYRVLAPAAGTVTSDGRDVWRMDPRALARELAVVVQEPEVEFDFTVSEVVMMGRAPHKSAFGRDTAEDAAIVREALARVGMAGADRRAFTTLSGGEKQRVLIARTLAQQARALVLDEPTNHLDLRYQLEILDLIRGLGVTAVMAVHDLNLAARYCDLVLLMSEGAVCGVGRPEDVLTASLVADVFGVRVDAAVLPDGRAVLHFELAESAVANRHAEYLEGVATPGMHADDSEI